MATTQNLYTGNGSTTNYSFTFEYLKQSDVKVTLNSVATTAFSFVNATTLAFTSAPGNGVGIRIYRDTAIDNLSSTFFPGSAIKAEDLNNNFTQNLYVTQEADTEVAAANTTAAAAVATANDADTKATNAVSTANTASTNATTAVNTANSAAANATSASNTATAAVATANSADTKADSAVADATTALGTANSAATNASAAVATANTADANATTALNNSRESDGSGGFTSAIDKATTALTSSTAAQSAATASANSATAAQNSATAAQTSAAASANVADAFTATGTPATALTVDVPIDVANGVKLPTNANSYDQEGAIRYNTTLDKIEIRKGSGWNTAAGGATVSSTPPSLASSGDVWYDHDNGRSYVYYNDGDSNQWVEMNPSWNGSVADGSVTPAKLSTGGPNWDTNGKILVNGARSHINANSSSYFQSTNNQTGQTATDGCVFGVSSGTNAILWNYESSNLMFGTGNVSRMVIDNSGNISIGPSGASNITLNPSGNITAAGRIDAGSIIKGTSDSGIQSVAVSGGQQFAFRATDNSGINKAIIYSNGTAEFNGQMFINCPNATALRIRQASGGANKIVLKNDGSAEFAGDVTVAGGHTTSDGVTISSEGQVKVRGDNLSSASAGLAIYRNGSSGTSIAGRINYDGSAEFDGNVQVNGDPNSGVEGTKLSTRQVAACSSATRYIYTGFTEGDTDPTFTVTAAGSATFAGGDFAITASGTAQIKNPAANADAIQIFDTNGSTVNTRLNNNGSATFVGVVNARQGVKVEYLTGTSQAFRVQTGGVEKATIKADGTATFAGGQASIDSTGNVFIGGTSAATADIALNANGTVSVLTTEIDAFRLGRTGVGYGLNIERSGLLQLGTSLTGAGESVGIELNPSGSATFAGTVISGTVNNSSYYAYLDNGRIQINRPDNSGAIYVTKNGSTTIELNANGSATFAGSVTASNVSDIRFKENITDANPQLADAVALGSQLKNFDWKDDAPLNEELRARRFLGLVAQEAEKVCPGLTYTVPRTKQGKELTPAVLDEDGNETKAATYEELDDSYKAINHDILVMKLLGAVAELSAEIKTLETKVAQLEANN